MPGGGVLQGAAQAQWHRIGHAPDDGTYEYVNKKTGEVMQVPKGIDPGFDYSVGEAKFGRRLSQDEYDFWNDPARWQKLTPGIGKLPSVQPEFHCEIYRSS